MAISTAVCVSLDCTGYTDTLTISTGGAVAVSGAITLGSGMGVASDGAGSMACRATATLTSNGIVMPWSFGFSGTSQTYTLADDWHTSSSLTTSGAAATAVTVNGYTFSAAGNFNTMSAITLSGTTTIILTGGTWKNAGGATVKNNLQFAGNVTLDNVTLNYNTGTITWVSGTITYGSSTLSLGAATTLNTPAASMSWNNITISANVTITLSAALNVVGTLLESAGGCTFVGAYAITCGPWTISGGTTATTTLSGTITASGLFTLSNSTATTFAGAFAVSVDSANISNTQTVTLVHDLSVSNLTTIADANVINGAFSWNTGGLTMTGALTGSSTITFAGTGTWSGTANLGLNAAVSTGGTLTISGSVSWGMNAGTFTYNYGTVTTTSSTLSIVVTGATGATFNTAGILWNNITIVPSEGSTLTLSSLMTVTGTLSLGATYDFVFGGTAGWTCATLSLSSYQFITLTAGNTYTITTTFTANSQALAAGHPKFTSSHATNKVAMVLGPGATQDLVVIDFVRVDASGGQTIYTYRGVLTTCFNIINSYPVNVALNDPSYQLGVM